MKRCNNCGWYNHDSATCCEKCEEESFEPVVEDVVFTELVTEPSSVAVQEPESEAVAVHEVKSAKNQMMETVAFGPVHVVPNQQVRKNLAATVMDATAVLRTENETHCPKCRYPIIGFVEYCPNCGATIRSNTEVGAPVSKVTKIESCDDVAKPLDLKATVRDIPEELVIKEDPGLFRLVPIDDLGEASYEMHLGDVIVLGGRRYKFEK